MYFSKSQNYLSQNKIHIGDKGDWRIATLETQVGVSVAVSPVTRPCAPRPCHGTSASQGPCEISLYQPYYRWDQNEPECVNNLPNTVLYADVIEPGDWGKQGKKPWLCVPCKAKPGPRSSVVRAALSPCPGRSRWLSQPYCHPPLICHPVHWYF
jgi:hypothetical protein